MLHTEFTERTEKCPRMMSCREFVRGEFPTNPVRLRRKSGYTYMFPCHEVADGFDFSASHRKIKKEFLAYLCELCVR